MSGSVSVPGDGERLARAALVLVCGESDPMMGAVLAHSSALVVWEVLHGEADAAEALARVAVPDGVRRRAFFTGRRWSVWRRRVASWADRVRAQPADVRLLEGFLTGEGRFRLVVPQDATWPVPVGDLALSGQFADPLCLWVWGDVSCLTACASPLAVVGSREATSYGVRVAGAAARAAVRAGHVVVSGGAMGIDQAAHRAAVDAGGRTVAVMAGGLNHAGPTCNLGLFDDVVASGGALVSELAPSVIPVAGRFLTRNRLIAALSRQTLVAQARHRSGSLNTAATAGLLGRVVTAVPGPVDQPFNAGCNQLVHDGRAILVTCSDDVLELLDDTHVPNVSNSAGAPVSSRADSETNTGNVSHDSDGKNRVKHAEDAASDATGPGLPDDERTVLAAVRAARRTGGVADLSAIAAHLSAAGHALPLPSLVAVLGRLELSQFVVRSPDGGYAVAKSK